MTCAASFPGLTRSTTIGALLAAAAAWASLACVSTQERMQSLRQAPAPRVDKLHPVMTMAGKGFQVQPSGDSAISVTGANFVGTSRVCFNGTPAVTTYASNSGLTAIMPADLYAREGSVQVTVQNGDGQVSNPVSFQVLPAAGPPPQISGLRPASCVIGQGFNVQPGGESAMAVDGANFLPGAAIFFDRSRLPSAFGNPSTVTAVVPASLLARPRTFQVHVENPDGKVSNSMTFSVLRSTP